MISQTFEEWRSCIVKADLHKFLATEDELRTSNWNAGYDDNWPIY